MSVAPIGRRSPEEQRAYSQGYAAGKKRLRREDEEAEARANAAVFLFEALAAGLVEQGLSLDEVLDAQIVGAKSLAGETVQ